MITFVVVFLHLQSHTSIKLLTENASVRVHGGSVGRTGRPAPGLGSDVGAGRPGSPSRLSAGQSCCRIGPRAASAGQRPRRRVPFSPVILLAFYLACTGCDPHLAKASVRTIGRISSWYVRPYCTFY